MEELLSATIHTAVDVGAGKKSEFKRVIVDTTVQEKAIAHPVDSRLLEIARRKVVAAAKRCGIGLKQTFAAEGKTLQRQAGGSKVQRGTRYTRCAAPWVTTCAG